MSLIACGTCGHGIAEEVEECPSCGKKYGAKRSKILCSNCSGLGYSHNCEKCSHTGYYLVSGGADICQNCNGVGHKIVQHLLKEGGFFTSPKYIPTKERCTRCGGSGYTNWQS